MRESQQRAVVLLSGGMDSCVCAALAARDYEAAAVLASYGQRTEEREQHSFFGICDRLGIGNRLVVRDEALQGIGGSALTDPNSALPESGGPLARTSMHEQAGSRTPRPRGMEQQTA